MAIGAPDASIARKMQSSRGFKDYAGPRIEGSRWVLKRGDEGFPLALEQIPDPPKALYGIGDPRVLTEGLAIIGARKATPYGLSCARRFSRLAAEQGIVIISGGAYGCDSAAHEAALECGGRTLAFLGGGCDQVYPPGNMQLFQRIVKGGGAVVSENEWSYPALPFTFRNRNRLIAGLAKATLIVEAGMPSGTFSTADEALNSGREVLVVPGSITSRTSAGSNRLLYQGAIPIVDDEAFHDVLFDLFGCLMAGEAQVQEGCSSGASLRGANALLDALSAQPMRLDEIIQIHGLLEGAQPGEALLALAELERDGLIARYPDGRYGAVLH